MTSVPKPLKFLRDEYGKLIETHQNMTGENKVLSFTALPSSHPHIQPALADIISWLGMTIGYKDRDCLKYKLIGTKESASDWGHEYVRYLHRDHATF